MQEEWLEPQWYWRCHSAGGGDVSSTKSTSGTAAKGREDYGPRGELDISKPLYVAPGVTNLTFSSLRGQHRHNNFNPGFSGGVVGGPWDYIITRVAICIHLLPYCAMVDASGLAPVAPMSPLSSRTSELSPTATLMEKVQTPPTQASPVTFIFGTGSSSSSFDFDSPRGGTSVYRHKKYYMDTDMVVFQVTGNVRDTGEWC